MDHISTGVLTPSAIDTFLFCLYLFSCLYPLKVQVHCPGHTFHLSVEDSELVGFVSFVKIS